MTEQELARWLGVPLRRVNAWLDSQRIRCEHSRDGSRVIMWDDVHAAVAQGFVPRPTEDQSGAEQPV